MISFNEYLSEDISAEMKKAFSTKEKNNLKSLFKEFNIDSSELTFKKADKSVITSYPSSKKKQIIVVKATYEWKVNFKGNQNTNVNFVICGEPKNHFVGTFGDATKMFGDATRQSKREFTLDKIKDAATEVWVAELGEAGEVGAGAKLKPELSFMQNYEILWIQAKAKLDDIPTSVRKPEDLYLLSYNIKHLYESLKEYKELAERMDKGSWDKDDITKMENTFDWLKSRIEKLCNY
jgi:hypothetical protein